MLRITREQFDDLYPDLQGHYDFFNDPVPVNTTKEEFEQRFLDLVERHFK